MSKLTPTSVAVLIAVVCISVQTPAVAKTNPFVTPMVTAHSSIFEFGSEASRLATYKNAAGETSFALSLTPQFDERRQLASDVVIYVDTSASQTGAFKKDSLATVQSLLANLNADDRVKLVAVDVDPVELTERFVTVDSDELKVAIEKLNQRVPLGSTDMSLMVGHATKQFSGGFTRNRNVVYIGDGVSRSPFLNSFRFKGAVKNLVDSRVSVSSFAIGPQRDVETLAALANHTGGNIVLDSDDPQSMTTGATALANTVHGKVFWPTQSKVSGNVEEFFPAAIPPLRADRDSIIVGTLAKSGNVNVEVEGVVNGKKSKMNWPVQVEGSNPDFAFLPKLIDKARKTSGLSLPTVGSAGLREMARVIETDSKQLMQLGSQALATGNFTAADTLAKAALKTDPMNGEAASLIEAARRAQQDDDNPFGEDDGSPFGEDDGSPFGEEGDSFEPGGETVEAAPAEMAEKEMADQEMADRETDPLVLGDTPMPDDQGAPLPNQLQPGESMPRSIIQDGAITDGSGLRMVDPVIPAPAFDNVNNFANEDETSRLLRLAGEESRQLIGRAEERQRAIEERLKARVRFEMARANEELGTVPGEALERLKSMIDILDQTQNINEGVRVDLRNRLESMLMSSRRRKVEFDDKLARQQKNFAISEDLQNSLAEYTRREEAIGTLVNKFSSLMDEGNFEAAQDVTSRAFELDPFNPLAVAADEGSRISVNFHIITELRRRREIGVLAALYQVEKSAVPFSGEPPLVFPDPLVWAKKKELRAKWQDVRLAGNEIDERILSQLDGQWSPDYDETSFIEIMDELAEEFKINVVLDDSAREDSLNEDTPVTFKVTGIRLRNALRLMLKKYNATFIVKDEVLRIISLDVASDPENFVTNVYNVGDLVAPRQNFGGGGLGGGGGQGGGGFGGGGGGRGGGGGGFGGGGQGGGGGGVFCIQDSIESVATAAAAKADTKSNDTEIVKPSVAYAKRKPIATPAGASPLQAWSNYFENNHPAPARVRSTMRKLMKDKQPEQVVGLVQGAIQNNQSEPWMYEAMVLAMEIAGQPKSEIERALLSSIDVSNETQDALLLAAYMAKSGMEKKAIRLAQDVVDESTVNPEPFVIALNAAKKINDIPGIQWATVGILGQAWPDHRDVIKKAFRAAQVVRMQLEKEGRTEELKEFNTQLDEALYRDCIVKVSWTGDADIDLHVQEPGGTVCSRLNERTTAGGVMLGDVFARDQDESGELAEYYVLPRGFSGDYKVLIRRVWGKVAGGKVTVAIYQHYRTAKQASQQKQIELDPKEGSMVQFALTDGRRVEALDEFKVEQVANQQFLMNREIVARKLAGAYSAESASDYFGSQRGSKKDGAGGSIVTNTPDGQFVRQANNVGYQPVITQLPEGTFLNINHATTSDRLYVLISPSPNFSTIGEVTTFNIAGDANTAQGAGGGGAIGGGAGGGAGGGIGGGLF